MASFERSQLDKQVEAVADIGTFDTSLPVEVQTDKDRMKLVPCRECKRPLAVTTFFAPAKAICGSCKGETVGTVATVGVPIPGQTDPAKAVNLADCLLNEGFKQPPLCPAHPDAGHEMELKMVTHSPHHGPTTNVPAESAFWQCTTCCAGVTLTTMYRSQFKRQNEVRSQTLDPEPMEDLLGVRDEDEAVAA